MPAIKHHTEAERKKIIESAQKAVLEDCRKRKEEAESWGPRGPTPDDDNEAGRCRTSGALRRKKILTRSARSSKEQGRQNAGGAS